MQFKFCLKEIIVPEIIKPDFLVCHIWTDFTGKNIHLLAAHTFSSNRLFLSSGHYGKENLRSGQDMHNFISSGFVTLGRGHLKGKVRPHYPSSLHRSLKKTSSDCSWFHSQSDCVMLSILSCQKKKKPNKKKSNEATVTFVSTQLKLDVARCHFEQFCISYLWLNPHFQWQSNTFTLGGQPVRVQHGTAVDCLFLRSFDTAEAVMENEWAVKTRGLLLCFFFYSAALHRRVGPDVLAGRSGHPPLLRYVLRMFVRTNLLCAQTW